MRCERKLRHCALLWLLTLLLLPAACGQKGALYLPEKPQAVPPQAPASDAPPADDDGP